MNHHNHNHSEEELGYPDEPLDERMSGRNVRAIFEENGKTEKKLHELRLQGGSNVLNRSFPLTFYIREGRGEKERFHQHNIQASPVWIALVYGQPKKFVKELLRETDQQGWITAPVSNDPLIAEASPAKLINNPALLRRLRQHLGLEQSGVKSVISKTRKAVGMVIGVPLSVIAYPFQRLGSKISRSISRRRKRADNEFFFTFPTQQPPGEWKGGVIKSRLSGQLDNQSGDLFPQDTLRTENEDKDDDYVL